MSYNERCGRIGGTPIHATYHSLYDTLHVLTVGEDCSMLLYHDPSWYSRSWQQHGQTQELHVPSLVEDATVALSVCPHGTRVLLHQWHVLMPLGVAYP